MKQVRVELLARDPEKGILLIRHGVQLKSGVQGLSSSFSGSEVPA